MSGDLEFLYKTGFDQQSANDRGDGFEPLPPGWYRVQVRSGEICSTRAGDGKYIKLRLDIEGPSHAGRVVFTNINVVNSSATAQEIGQAQFARLLTSAGLESPKDLSLLVGKSVEAKLTIRPAKDGYEASNDVQSFRRASAGPVNVNGATGASAGFGSEDEFGGNKAPF